MARVSLLASKHINIERYAYCLCLHVRPATIFVAVVNLAGSMLCALLTFVFLVTAESQEDSYLSSKFLHSNEMCSVNLVAVMMYLLLALVSAMLLYGVIKSKPRYILPFFGIQFIDYLFTLPQFFASISHPYHYYVAKSRNDLAELIPAADKAENVDEMRNLVTYTSSQASDHVHGTSLVVLTLILMFKTYFLCVVWKCYRYLQMQELLRPITLNGSDLDPESATPPPAIIIRCATASVPPPNYDEATKIPDYKPPEYSTVIGESVNVPTTPGNNQQQQK